jgi:hypothetical protein
MSRRLFAPLLIALAGLGWLLNALRVFPEVNWLWTVLLAGAGLLLMVLNGINSSTILFGPLLMTAGLLLMLHQVGTFTLAVELPILLIVFAALWAVSEHPRWKR